MANCFAAQFGGWLRLVLCDHRVICSRTSSLDSENLLGVKWVPVRRALSQSIFILGHFFALRRVFLERECDN